MGIADRSLNRNLVEQVAQLIGEKILVGEFLLGRQLGDESSLCLDYSVSWTVVREAVKMQISKGMLEVRPRTGTRVLGARHWQLLDRDVLLWRQSIPADPKRLSQLAQHPSP